MFCTKTDNSQNLYVLFLTANYYAETMNYAFFSNTKCEYFPCHEKADPENFNCLFCYCPLYCLGDNCGGRFSYLDNGYKDCSGCIFPHRAESYDLITSRYAEIMNAMRSLGNGE